MKKKIIILEFIFIFFLSYSVDYQADIKRLYTSESLIQGKTSRLNFTGEFVITANNFNEEEYIILDTGRNNGFIKFSNLEVKRANGLIRGNRVYFKNSNGKNLRELSFTLEGTLIFDWSKRSNGEVSILERVSIGKFQIENEEIFCNLYLKDLNPINELNVKVEEEMDLGVTFAGEKMGTKLGNGHPANIKIEGEAGKNVRVTIPNTTRIKNDVGDTLLVNLEFRENRSDVLVKNLKERNGNERIGEVRNIYIDGECQTLKNSSGLYEGSFIVRVEYES